MNDYERMARIIRYLDASYLDQPTLADLAKVAGLSPFHFHRLFSTWVGITPKDFVQCLTLAHAKELLKKGESVLETSLETGLSGPGRLHDLCVTLEAATPGEIKEQGRGVEIGFGFGDTPFGECLLGQSPRGICYLVFVARNERQLRQRELAAEWPNATMTRCDKTTSETINRIFTPQPNSAGRQEIRAWVNGSAFQLRVWRALLNIPVGTLVSYGRLASAIGQSTASRAVGRAVGSNPIAFLIPCHRVIQKTGAIGGYRWGSGRKRALIAWESATNGR